MVKYLVIFASILLLGGGIARQVFSLKFAPFFLAEALIGRPLLGF